MVGYVISVVDRVRLKLSTLPIIGNVLNFNLTLSTTEIAKNPPNGRIFCPSTDFDRKSQFTYDRREGQRKKIFNEEGNDSNSKEEGEG